MTRPDYVRITEGARALLESRVAELEWARSSRNPWQPMDDQERAWLRHCEDDYSRTVLGAWDGWRPNGPLAGEVLPNEVVRLRERLAQRTDV